MDNTFWATVALLIFVAVVIYLKVPATLSKALDARAERIRAELEQARILREESQRLLADFQRRRQEAEREAGDIVASARREADALLVDAKQKTDEYVVRRTAMAEQKIAQAEREAVAEVRASAVDIAVEAARRLLADKVDARVDAQLFTASLPDFKGKLN